MSKKVIVKIISAIMALTLLFSLMPFNAVYAADSNAAKKQQLQQELDDINKKLKKYGSESKETEEYISTLDKKIKYLTEQYNLTKQEVKTTEQKITDLQKNIQKNTDDITTITAEVNDLQAEIETLNDEFADTYDAYCNRIRALYVSGNKGSVLSFLLTSDGISNLLTRYEMVSAVSKKDGELMQDVKDQTEKIVSVKNKLDTKKQNLSKTQNQLKTNKTSLEQKQTELSAKQKSLDKQQSEIESQQKEANTLLKSLNEKTEEYGEYRDITQEELDEIDDAIAEADKKYAKTTTTTKKATTKKATTTTKKATTKKSGTTTTKKATTTTTTTKKATTTTTASSSQYIKLTYPCPAYTTITCGFGAYSGHTGCDFSTQKHENQKIVAAESGTVILVKILEYSYGHYVVIRHDKTTSSGKAVYTLYAHNNNIIVSEGQYVKKGQQIAYSGTTGNSTGPHCHFEVRVGGSRQSNAVNPTIYLP